MIIDMNYWTKVFRKILILFFTIIGIYIAFRFAIFYMPFLIAFIISLIIEPIIRFIMRNLKLKRKVSSIIVFILTLSIIIGLLSFGIITLISESYNLLNGLNGYFVNISSKIQQILSRIDLSKLNLSNDIINTIQSSALSLLSGITDWAKSVLTQVLSIITAIPSVMIYVVITILSLYFICTDKIYMLDQIEHHLPKTWVKKLTRFIKDVSSSLGALLKAQVILITVSFIICLTGLTIFNLIGLNVAFPLLSALGIAFVDALPIFGSASAIVPWAVISAINGDMNLAICLIILLAIMAIIRQLLEPKIVSGQIGIHPIFTLIAMYTGFKFLGVLGLLFGPIILIILNKVFSKMIDKGVAKAIFERE